MSQSDITKIPVNVRQVILQLNDLFVEYVGPVGQDLSDDVLERWLVAEKFGPSAIRQYVSMLSENLDSATERQEFLRKAEKLMLS